MSADPSFNTPLKEYACGTTLSASDPISFENARGARLLIDSGSSMTSLSFYETDNYTQDDDGNDTSDWYLCSDSSATLTVDASASNVSYAVDDSLFAVGMCKIVADVAGTLKVVLKG